MAEWLGANWGNLIVGGVLLLVMLLIALSAVRRARSGSCCCGCSGCGCAEEDGEKKCPRS